MTDKHPAGAPVTSPGPEIATSADSARHGKASRRIADGLRASILSGELPPGSRIRQEEIAAQYGASRIPVRGALSILEADGLVRLVANSGAWVARFSRGECEEFYQIREHVEPLLLRASLPGLTPEILDRMDDLAEEMAHTGRAEHFLRLDREFHALSYSGARTVVLHEIVQRMWNMTHHYRLMFTQVFLEQRSTIVHDEHRMLVRALREGDADQADLVVRGHIRRTRLQLAQHPELFDVLPSGPD
ncbi:DNA-binding GntR family transcriptional regulator [Thermocatellispora tengchongensis]|uniref:DNA-binding GntR family transcriptional regulator n=1 Tax=Thermocatellispora tengchongensis TaxID=1073253 RepID=A0A840PHG4_9ACTN|nr:GntR family transcriptional regulator [Thermocatellispora tengchongensis]MBB5137261.1 DNA-binding GntR family transcriptional regulator [Thermocatellispora tengchongensis]